VDHRNIAQKSIAVALDKNPGGIVKSSRWSIFEHDLMNVSAFWQTKPSDDILKNFVDWRGIAWDGSHNSYTAISGQKIFVNPNLPGWANPGTGDFKDLRLIGRDKRRFGPLPQEWMHLRGLYKHGQEVVIHYTVGKATIYERHQLENENTMSRILNISNSDKALLMRLCPVDGSSVVLKKGSSADVIKKVLDEGGKEFYALAIKKNSGDQKIKVLISNSTKAALKIVAQKSAAAEDLTVFLKGAKGLWPEEVKTKISAKRGQDDQDYVVETFELPRDNPWKTMLRVGGFDFYPGSDKAAVATWNGDVWIVTGLTGKVGDTLTWKRVASGLFQPLGVIIKDDVIHVTCRDQLVRLHDLNGDGQMDWYENFNSDHQVTEHFHEFAMGLQIDKKGNFYYAKSARHAKVALVPHHGTLIKVAADGKTSKILANGFRAANGVCINDDGSFFVTDQQGHWTPENRINRVVEGGYYGNHMGYHDKKTSDDSEMEVPMLWVSNRIDRSPAELIWVDSDRWGPLKGSLLNISYGAGKIFVIPQGEVNGTWQAGICELPVGQFPTGVMRGRFSKKDGQLYVCGLFAWAGSARAKSGGFYRVRYQGPKNKLFMPLTWDVEENGLSMTFTDPIGTDSLKDLNNFKIETFKIKRTSGYGSKHTDKKEIIIEAASLSADGRTLTLTTKNLTPARLVEMMITLYSKDNKSKVTRKIHGSIFKMK
jgi:hypothetical protein